MIPTRSHQLVGCETLSHARNREAFLGFFRYLPLAGFSTQHYKPKRLQVDTTTFLGIAGSGNLALQQQRTLDLPSHAHRAPQEMLFKKYLMTLT